MKKKILGLFMTLAFIFTVGISNVSAAVLTVNEIYNVLSKDSEETVQLNENIITIKDTSEDGFEYIMDLKYENNILSFTNNRDVSKMTQKERTECAISDGLMSMAIIMSLLDLYGIEDFFSINQEEFGITLVEGEEISYEETSDVVVEETDDPNVKLESTVDGSIKTNEVKSFSIDMVKFDAAATNYKANSSNDSVKEETTEKVEEQVQEEIKTELEQVEVKEDTTTEKNPQTGIESIGMIAILFVLISLMSYLIIRNKKIFVK